MKNADEFARHKLQMLVLDRRDASRNIVRFYVLAIQPTLFGDTALVREWAGSAQRGVFATTSMLILKRLRKLWISDWRGKRAAAIGSGLERHAGSFTRIPTSATTEEINTPDYSAIGGHAIERTWIHVKRNRTFEPV
jgi:hypothetical protein